MQKKSLSHFGEILLLIGGMILVFLGIKEVIPRSIELIYLIATALYFSPFKMLGKNDYEIKWLHYFSCQVIALICISVGIAQYFYLNPEFKTICSIFGLINFLFWIFILLKYRHVRLVILHVIANLLIVVLNT